MIQDINGEPMRPLDVDEQHHAESLQTDAFRVRDLFDPSIRGRVVMPVMILVLSSVAGGSMVAAGNYAGAGLAVLGVVLAILGLDATVCSVSSNHECWSCRRETNRWVADDESIADLEVTA